MKDIDALIAERNERLAFIGVDDRCPGTHSPVISGKCPACVANKSRVFFRAAVEEDFRRAVSDAHAEPQHPCGNNADSHREEKTQRNADYGRAVMSYPLPPLPPRGRVTSESATYPPTWKSTTTPATIKEKEKEFRRRVFADNSLSTLGKLAVASGYSPYPGSPYFPDDQKEPK